MKKIFVILVLVLVAALLVPQIVQARDVDGRITSSPTQTVDSGFAKWHPADNTGRTPFPDPQYDIHHFRVFPCLRVVCGTPAPRP
jgi:hypothetical protein